MVLNQSPQSKKEPKWRILAQVSENIYILCSTSDGYVRYAPMYIHNNQRALHRLWGWICWPLSERNRGQAGGTLSGSGRRPIGRLQSLPIPRAREIDTGILRESWLAEKAFRKTHRGWAQSAPGMGSRPEADEYQFLGEILQKYDQGIEKAGVQTLRSLFPCFLYRCGFDNRIQ